jgi:hypothetical protein
MAGCSWMTAADGSHLGSQLGYLDPPGEPPGMNPPGAGPAPLWEVQVRNRAEVAVAIRRTAFLLPSPAPGAGRSPNSARRDPVCRLQPGRATSAEPGAVRAYVARVQGGAAVGGEYQRCPASLPRPRAARRPGCRTRHAAPGLPLRGGRGCGGTVRSWSRRARALIATPPRTAGREAWRPGRRPGRRASRRLGSPCAILALMCRRLHGIVG